MFSAIKFSLGDEVRRITVLETELSYPILIATAKRLFPALEGCEVSFAWIDDEDDCIQLSSEEELLEAFRIMESQNKSAVRFEIVKSSASADPNLDVNQNDGTKSTSLHRGVTCDECNMAPIIGIRYKCAVRKDYDLCANCEAKRIQPHPMVKIYTPAQAPAAIFIAVNDGDIPAVPDSLNGHNYFQFSNPIHHPSSHEGHHHHHEYHPRHYPGDDEFYPPFNHHHPHHPKPRCGRGRCRFERGGPGRGGPGRGRGSREEWRKFVEDAIASAATMANSAVNLAQTHIAAATANMKPSEAQTQTHDHSHPPAHPVWPFTHDHPPAHPVGHDTHDHSHPPSHPLWPIINHLSSVHSDGFTEVISPTEQQMLDTAIRESLSEPLLANVGSEESKSNDNNDNGTNELSSSSSSSSSSFSSASDAPVVTPITSPSSSQEIPIVTPTVLHVPIVHAIEQQQQQQRQSRDVTDPFAILRTESSTPTSEWEMVLGINNNTSSSITNALDHSQSTQSQNHSQFKVSTEPQSQQHNHHVHVHGHQSRGVVVGDGNGASYAHAFITTPVVRPSVMTESVPVSVSVPVVRPITQPTEMDIWRTELLLLENMGFVNVEENLLSLRKFATPAVSQQPMGAVPDSEAIQRVVNELLSI